MQYILAGTLCLMCLSFKKQKGMYFILILFLWLLAAFNFATADKSNYYYSYLQAGSNQEFLNTEIAFQITLKLANFLGMNFSIFLAIYFCIGLLLISRVILKYTNNPGYILVLYFIYPFIIDVAQIRNFMAMSIMLNAVPLLASYKKNDLVKYLLLILVATLFHYSAIFYVLFLLVKGFSIKKLFNFVVVITLTGTIFNLFLVNIVVDMLPFLEQKVNRYTQSSISIYSQVGMLLYLTVGMALVYIAWKKLKNDYNFSSNILVNETSLKLKVKKITPEFADVILKINLIMFALYPFLLYALEFIRIYRNILILNYILFASVIFIKRKTMFQDLSFQFFILVFVILSFWYYIYFPFSETVVFPLFENNYLFK